MISSKVLFVNNIKSALADFFSSNNYSKIAILVDENTKKLCLPSIINKNELNNFLILKIRSGEKNKNINSCIKIWDKLTNNKFDRNSLIINLGGGVITDMGGFIAATYKRGIDFINIPTTLLAQVDASVGGKLGVDFNNYKNQIGLFKESKFTFIDTKFLLTLSRRELNSGYAEIIKHCIIKDKSKFDEIYNQKIDKNNWKNLIKHSVDIKSTIVKSDLKENGLRKILNFGHTIGHAIESTYMTKEKKLLHGEAIAIGMICESYISYKVKKLKSDELKKISNTIIKIFDPKKIHFFQEIIEKSYQDKKNINNKIKICVLDEIGKCNYDYEINENLIVKSLEYYNKIL